MEDTAAELLQDWSLDDDDFSGNDVTDIGKTK